ncbi:unnamed protein product [Coffea canephora]|uniref:DH200=94 genomic scaffold, scaffold_1590 n=1 Tax=Coffea canephora TaxID=49390 RepID=A0A068VJ46_COFCA|nr:unnamed protein product [Coffea canephora]
MNILLALAKLLDVKSLGESLGQSIKIKCWT